MVFPVVIYECESWTVKKAKLWRIDAFKLWCWRKTLESPLDCKEIQPVHSKGDQSLVFIGTTDAEAETPILWPPHVKSWLIGKDPGAGRDWGQEEMGTMEDEMAGWHHWLDRHEFEWTPGVGDGQGGLSCCDSWGCKESDTTEWLNWTELMDSEAYGCQNTYIRIINVLVLEYSVLSPQFAQLNLSVLESKCISQIYGQDYLE